MFNLWNDWIEGQPEKLEVGMEVYVTDYMFADTIWLLENTNDYNFLTYPHVVFGIDDLKPPKFPGIIRYRHNKNSDKMFELYKAYYKTCHWQEETPNHLLWWAKGYNSFYENLKKLDQKCV